MAIDFNRQACIEDTTEEIFGICDDPPPDKNPAYLDYSKSDKWIVWVDNPNSIEITFTAIDHCVNIPWGEGERCEAMLTYGNAIMFIELKDSGGGSRWAGKARNQLENTIRLFKRDVGLSMYVRNYAHIANKQRPNFKSGGSNFSQKFEDNTGFVLRVSDVIEIR